MIPVSFVFGFPKRSKYNEKSRDDEVRGLSSQANENQTSFHGFIVTVIKKLTINISINCLLLANVVKDKNHNQIETLERIKSIVVKINLFLMEGLSTYQQTRDLRHGFLS